MKTFLTALLSLFTVAFLSVATLDDAQAKRMGGGKSFGGKSTFSQAAPKPTPSKQQIANNTQNAQQRAALSQRGGLMGMLGGLALGGLLGALFFGGAFENINFFDIVIFGLIAFLLYKLFARRKATAQAQHYSATNNQAATAAAAPVPNNPRHFDTDLLFKKESGIAASSSAIDQSYAYAQPAVPADFDTTHFLEGAKLAYQRLQQAWDAGDLADIREFTTDSVFAEIQDQLSARQGQNRTDILTLDAQLLEVKNVGANTEAAVLFEVLLREIEEDTLDISEPSQVREIWHFTRPTRSKQPTWYLDGIQQIED